MGIEISFYIRPLVRNQSLQRGPHASPYILLTEDSTAPTQSIEKKNN